MYVYFIKEKRSLTVLTNGVSHERSIDIDYLIQIIEEDNLHIIQLSFDDYPYIKFSYLLYSDKKPFLAHKIIISRVNYLKEFKQRNEAK